MDVLRHVRLNGYTLKVWDTHTEDRMGKSILGYEFRKPGGKVLFAGTDFHASPLHAVDSDSTMKSLLTFLTLRPGDTDPEYFSYYNKEQLEFARTDAEQIQLELYEDSPLTEITSEGETCTQ